MGKEIALSLQSLLIDTDVLIDYLRGNDQAADFLESTEKLLYISCITVAELFAGVREGEERIILEKFLRSFDTIAIDEKIVQKGGLFRRDFGKSHGVGLANAIIAASATEVGATLITLNQKHFPMLNNIQVPYQKS